MDVVEQHLIAAETERIKESGSAQSLVIHPSGGRGVPPTNGEMGAHGMATGAMDAAAAIAKVTDGPTPGDSHFHVD